MKLKMDYFFRNTQSGVKKIKQPWSVEFKANFFIFFCVYKAVVSLNLS
jgi:hypothetical protein